MVPLVLVDNATFEKHYRIGELAELWGLGRETVPETGEGRSRRYQDQDGPQARAHGLQRP